MPTKESTTDTNPTVDVTSPYTPRRPAPVISVSINHPIGTALRKIKNFLTHRQTLFATSFTIKVTPIVALVSLFGLAALFGGGVTTAYNFGKTVQQKLMASMSTNPIPTIATVSNISIVTKTGTIKATYQNPPAGSGQVPSPTVILNASEGSQSTSSSNTVSPTSTPTPHSPTPGQAILHYILVSRTGSITYLSVPSTVHLQTYLNARVLITGSFDSSKNTLTITKQSDIEILQ